MKRMTAAMNANVITLTGLVAATAVAVGMMLSGMGSQPLGFPAAGEVLFDGAAFWSLLAALFAIMNPLVAVPFFAAITEGESQAGRNRLARNATIAVAITLAIAALLGDTILGFFAISIGSFRIAGGIIVLLMGIGLIRSSVSAAPDGDSAGNPASQAICPIAIPLLAGPGAIANIIVHCDGATHIADYMTLAAVLAAMVVIVYVTLRVAIPVARFLGETGLTVASRLFGMIVIAIAIDMATIGLGLRFPSLLG